MWEAAHGWWQTLGEVRPSWPVGGQSAAAEALPGASPDAGPTAWALREQGKESPREERRRAFPGAGTPWEKEAARLVVGPSLWGSPWRGKQTVLPECSNPAATHPHWTLTTRRSIVCWGTRSSWASFAQPPPFTDGETEVQRGVLTLTPAPLPPEAIVLW